MNDLFGQLEKLASVFGPAGHEEDISSFISGEIKGSGDELFNDVMGNLVLVRRNPAGKKILLAAHMDEIGMLVTFVEENGFLRFSPIGGLLKNTLLGTRVIFRDGTAGVIGRDKKAPWEGAPDFSSFYIDIGAKTKEEALERVKIGSAATFYPSAQLMGSRVMSKSMDNRAGCALLLQTIKNLPAFIPNEVYFVFTVQEEVGLRGAKTAAYSLNPDFAIAADVTRTGDTPDPEYKMDVALGKGPAIKIKDSSVICHPAVVQRMVGKAEQMKMPFQPEVLESGGTDAGSIHLTREGVPSGAISIPCRYVHTPGEMIDLTDLQGGVSLLVELLREKW
jgi:endoglucanase